MRHTNSQKPSFVRRPWALFKMLLCLLGITACAESQDSPKAGSQSGVVLITGANRGLGLEFARQYAADGWTVLGTARKPDEALALSALGVEVLPLDVTDRESIASLAIALEGRPLDMLINNAGIFPRLSSIEDVDADSYAQILMVNTLGPVLVTQALLPNLRQGALKRIINITSQLGSIENSDGSHYGYRESKAALNMFTKSLAAELGPEGFISLAIHPGWVQTELGGEGARLTPEESVTAMRKVIDHVTPENNGEFRAFYGDRLPW